MPEFEYVVPVNNPLKVSEDSVFSMADLFKCLKSWFDRNGYLFYEKEYLDKVKETGKQASVKWAPEKKVDDYVKLHIDVRIKFNNLRDVEGKHGMMNKGSVSVKFESFIEKDYEDRWESNFLQKFMRSMYDYFVLRDKLDTDKEQLKQDTYAAFNEVKAFLGLHRFKE